MKGIQERNIDEERKDRRGESRRGVALDFNEALSASHI